MLITLDIQKLEPGDEVELNELDATGAPRPAQWPNGPMLPLALPIRLVPP